MLMQQGQELVAEIMLLLSSVVLQGLQVLAMPMGVHLVILISACPGQCCLHVHQLTSHLQEYTQLSNTVMDHIE